MVLVWIIKSDAKTLSNTEIIIEADGTENNGCKPCPAGEWEANKTVGIEYFLNAIKLFRPYFCQYFYWGSAFITRRIPVIAWCRCTFWYLCIRKLIIRLFTKNIILKERNPISDFRLDTPDRIGEAGLHKIGLGVLLGLEDWRVDSFFNALHIDSFQKQYWQTKFWSLFPAVKTPQKELYWT